MPFQATSSKLNPLGSRRSCLILTRKIYIGKLARPQQYLTVVALSVFMARFTRSSLSPATEHALFVQFLSNYNRSAIIQPRNERYCTQNALSYTMKFKQYTTFHVLFRAGKPGPGRDYFDPVFFSHPLIICHFAALLVI